MTTRKGLKPELVSDAIIENATRFFLTHPLSGQNPDHIDTLGYPKQVVETFRKNLADGQTNCEGFRFGVEGWGHAKWRFKIDVFGDKLFYFLIYPNCDRKDEKRIGTICQKIADDLTKTGYPTLVS